jgi:ATP-binding cassette subfamily F protein 3
MIQVVGLSKTYGERVLFDEVTFTVGDGERVGLVGRNGHGKTTLFRLILGDALPDSGTITRPDNYRIGHLSQRISFTEGTVLEESCLNLPPAEDGRDETYKAKSVLRGLGLGPEEFDRSPWELSGGFQVRLNLAKVLIGEPDLLLLDEPTNYLDILAVRWLTQFLRNWRNDMILITHDRAFMDSVTTHTMGIHRGRIRKIAGPTQKLYDQILLEEEVYERTRNNDEKRRREVEQFINRFRAQATRARAVQSKIKALQRHERIEELRTVETLDFEFRSAPFPGKWLLEVDDLGFSFDPKGPPLISSLSFGVGGHDRIGVIGRNGKGKTTLLNLLAGEISPQQGEIRHHPHLRSAYFGQTNIDRLDPAKTVEEEILDAQEDENRRAARTICGIMMFEGDDALKKVSVLSGGERSRVLLGKLLTRPANLLLLDEPTNHLDMESVDSLLQALEAFDGAALIVTHSEMILRAFATRLIVFDGGVVCLFEGTYEDFLDRVGWQDEAGGQPPESSNGSPQSRTWQRRDHRRLRAELIDSRARVLGGLQSRISAAEGSIMSLEAQITEDTAVLISASEKGDWQTISRLSKAIDDAKVRIEELFAELESATEEHAARTREFDEKLRELLQSV